MLKICLLAGCSLLALSAAIPGVEAAPIIFGYTGTQQTWTVPAAGAYTIVAAGARGGDEIYTIDPSSYGGKGAQVTATFDLAASEVLTLLVGGRGGNAQGGGYFGAGGNGGGSFVFGPGFAPLLVAGGGGGGGGGCCQSGGNGVESTSGGNGHPGHGGRTVSGGTNGLGGAAYLGGGGAGVRGGGGTGVCLPFPTNCTVPGGGRSSGGAFAGGAGGSDSGTTGGRGGAGGFGGGGGGGGNTAGGGGGGGYSGGGGGTTGGGGGGSFIAGSGRGVYFNYSSARDGSVSISAAVGTPEPVPEPGSLALFGPGALGLAALSRRRRR